MSHEIEQSEDLTKAAFVSYREDAWHRLGTVVTEAISATEALKIAHLNGWDVRKSELQTVIGGKVLDVPDQFAIVRDNPFKDGQIDVLGVAGKGYTPVQNEDNATTLDTLMLESGGTFETAGSIRDGQEVFITVKLPECMMVGGEDAVDMYMAALNSHNGQKSFRFIVTPVRVVCANTQAAAINAATASFSRRHTRNANDAIVSGIREALDITYKFQSEFQTEADKMIEASYTDAEFAKLTENLFPLPADLSDVSRTVIGNAEAHREGLTALWNGSPTAASIRGTRWAAFQAVTEYHDHFMEFKGKDDVQAADFRALSAIGSSVSQSRKDKAFQLLTV